MLRGDGRICHAGRTYDEYHATCRSCQRQNAAACKGKSVAAKERWEIQTYSHEGKLVTTKTLETPNKWTQHPSGRLVYQQERRAWGRVVGGPKSPAPYIWSKATGKRRLIVTRYVVRPQGFIKDRTNQEGAIKPLEDALVKAGYLVDDREEWMERGGLIQEVDPANPRVEIELIDI